MGIRPKRVVVANVFVFLDLSGVPRLGPKAWALPNLREMQNRSVRNEVRTTEKAQQSVGSTPDVEFTGFAAPDIHAIQPPPRSRSS